MLSNPNKDDRFPLRLFMVYILYYAAHAIYGSYLNLYLNQVGLTKAQIGLTGTIPVAFLLVTQFLWGVAADKARSKNIILIILYACSIGLLFLFYTSRVYIALILFITLFQIFYCPIQALQDTLAMELQKDTKWDFGKIRLGGTIGYAICAAVIGTILLNVFGGDYANIFWLTSAILTCGLIFLLTLPKVKSHRKPNEKVDYRRMFQNKVLICLIFFNLVYQLGTNIFYSYYNIYFTDTLGATSRDVGILLFICAITEVPFLLFSKKIVNKLGFKKVMIYAGIVTSIRWLLLYFLKNIPAIFAVNTLHGMGFVGFQFCVVLFINDNVPAEMRGSAQMVNAMIGMIFSKVIFGYLSGKMCDYFGVNNIMLVVAIIMMLGSIIFALWYSYLEKKKNKQLSA